MGLSEQKERMIFSADPRNTTWSSDKGRFGFKMLEKMGWSEGKGLGANEDGMKEHVKIKLKTNNFGIGADKKNIRNWLENADGFSELLSRLNSDTNTPSETVNDDSEDTKKRRKKDEKKMKKKRAKDAEQKSANETANATPAESTETVLNAASVRLNRLSHRTRFRNMKKMALQDEKGLQEIFGVRSAPSTFASTPDANHQSESPGVQSGESTPLPLPLHTTQTVETGVSVSDYFAQKLAANPALAAIYGVEPASTKPVAPLDSESSPESVEPKTTTSKKRKTESTDSKKDRKRAKEDRKQAKEEKRAAKKDKREKGSKKST
ncbi:hypothetical protein GGI20_004048 [Coemansia sp. BCRC 34301]|nr:hypothetical protein GGI20_004048 [Coemansia sp. BCRC 34301]